MSDQLQKLIDSARSYVMSPEEHQAQRRSFAYGNTKIGNDLVTRETVNSLDGLLLTERRPVNG